MNAATCRVCLASSAALDETGRCPKCVTLDAAAELAAAQAAHDASRGQLAPVSCPTCGTPTVRLAGDSRGCLACGWRLLPDSVKVVEDDGDVGDPVPPARDDARTAWLDAQVLLLAGDAASWPVGKEDEWARRCWTVAEALWAERERRLGAGAGAGPQ